MAEAERFFESSSGGDVGAPKTPKKHKRLSMISPPASTPAGKIKKRKISMAATTAVGSTKKTLAKDPTGLTGGAEKKIIPGFNLAGRPGLLKDSEQGIHRETKKFVKPLSMSTINTDNEWTFVVQSNKNEFIRFFPNSMTVSLYSSYPNPATAAQRAVVGANDEVLADRHSCRALSLLPNVFVDPSVMGTSFVKSVRVTINGVPLQSDNFLDPHLLHYVRCNRIFNNHPEPFFATQKTLGTAVGNDRSSRGPVMTAALKPFDHVTWDSQRPVRIPIYLDGIWPFDNKCKTLMAIDQDPIEALYLPPDSRIEVTVELHRDKNVGVFMDACNTFAEYYQAGAIAAPTVTINFKDVLLEYESCELQRAQHEQVIKKYREGLVAKYDFDIVRSQHQILSEGVTLSVNWFQIMPKCRFIYLMFLQDHAIFPMPAKNRPISGFSKFPAACTSMKLEFGGEPGLITEELENFGITSTNHEISKKIFFDYLTSNNMFVGKFEQLFSAETATQSLIQVLPLDVKHLMSNKTERLLVEMKFSGGTASPGNQLILCLSIHPNGRAICSADREVHDWKWEFKVL